MFRRRCICLWLGRELFTLSPIRSIRRELRNFSFNVLNDRALLLVRSARLLTIIDRGHVHR